MAAKKRSTKQEPVLNTVARKLGHAAGTLTKVTQKLTENLAGLPETVTTRVQKATTIGTPARGRTQTPKRKTRNTARAKRGKGREPSKGRVSRGSSKSRKAA